MATLTWVASGPGLASDGLNWSGGVAPMTGDVVVFDSTSVNNCLWDLDVSVVTVNSITLATGYTGTLTQGNVDIGIGAGGIVVAEGSIFTANAKKIVYCDGSAVFGTSSLTYDCLNIVLTGNGVFAAPTGPIRSFTLSGEYIAQSRVYTSWVVPSSFVNITGHLDLNGNTMSIHYWKDGCRINGTVMNGTVLIIQRSGAYYGGEIDSDSTAILNFQLEPNQVKESTITSTSGIRWGGQLIVRSYSSATITIDLNGYNLTAASVTVGDCGNILWGEGTHRIGSLDTSAGASDFESSQVIMTGGSIKLGAGQAFHDLITLAEAVTLQSDVAVNNMLAHVGPIERGAYSLTLADPTKEYTGLRRPLVRPLVLARIEDPICRPLLEGIVRA